MFEHWARHTHGMMGRSPDYMNTVLMSFASSAALLKDRDHCFPEHVQALYERAAAQDLSFTHTFITPQVNRSQMGVNVSPTPISAKVVDKNEKGLIIHGARILATQGGLTDEVLVVSLPKMYFESDEAFAFSIPSNTKGVKFICRNLSYSENHRLIIRSAQDMKKWILSLYLITFWSLGNAYFLQ